MMSLTDDSITEFSISKSETHETYSGGYDIMKNFPRELHYNFKILVKALK